VDSVASAQVHSELTLVIRLALHLMTA